MGCDTGHPSLAIKLAVPEEDLKLAPSQAGRVTLRKLHELSVPQFSRL